MESFVIKTLKSLKKFSTKIAVKYKGKNTTYRELDTLSVKICFALINHSKFDVNTKKIGVMLNKSETLIAAMISVFRLGHIYVPLDANYPISRLEYMCNSVNLDIILTSKKFQHLVPKSLTSNILFVEQIENDVLKHKELENKVSYHKERPIYIFFTSGTTGKPKGILFKDSNLTNYLNWCTSFFKREKINFYISCSSIGFDPSIMEILYPLITGKTIISLNNSLFLGVVLNRVKEKVMLSTVPSVLNHLVTNNVSFKNVSDLKLTGEKPNKNDLDVVFKNNEQINVWNLYGPTETTIISSVFLIKKGFNDKLISAGKPIKNMKIKVLDKSFNEEKIGSVGEIFIGGPGVAIGYLEENANQNFVTLDISNDEVFYRTGDLGWKNKEGFLFLKGRKDSQFKKNGVRIEASEIENVANSNEKVRKSILIVDDNKNLYLFVQKKIEHLTEKELHNYVKDRVLKSMIPQKIIFVRTVPITVNGKVNKFKLLENFTNENR